MSEIGTDRCNYWTGTSRGFGIRPRPITTDVIWNGPRNIGWFTSRSLDRRIFIFLAKVRLSNKSAFGDPIPNHIVLIGRKPQGIVLSLLRRGLPFEHFAWDEPGSALSFDER